MSIVVGSVAQLGIDGERVRQFYRQHWARPVMLAEQSFYQWQFCQPPANAGSDSCVVAYDQAADTIAGAMGLNDRTFQLNGQSLLAGEQTTWIVAQAYRGRGVGGQIVRYITDKYQLLIGMGVSPSALPIYLRNGFRFFRQIPRFIKVLNYPAIAPYCQTEDHALGLINAWQSPGPGVYKERSCTPESIDQAFAQAANYLNLSARRHADCSWRYSQHPYFDYQMHLLEAGGGAKAWVAFRIHQPREGFRILHLLDVIGHPDALDAGRCFVEDYARNHSVDVIDFYCTAPAVYRHFMANRWFSVADDEYFRFPHLFSPVEMRQPPTTSLLLWSRNHLLDLIDFSRLYISKQDADLDRPTPYDFPVPTPMSSSACD